MRSRTFRHRTPAVTKEEHAGPVGRARLYGLPPYEAIARHQELLAAADADRVVPRYGQAGPRSGKPVRPAGRASSPVGRTDSRSSLTHHSAQNAAAVPAQRTTPVRDIALDIGLPIIAYYGLHALGASDWVGLLTATVVSGVRVVWTAVCRRRLTWFAVMMLAVFGLGLALAFLGGDARVLLLKDSVSTAALGIIFLLSLLGERPVTLSAAESWRPRRAQVLTELYRQEPAARRAFRVSALAWGIGLLAESVLRIPIVAWLPIQWAVGLSTAWMITAMAALTIWNAAYITRAARRVPALRSLLPRPPDHPSPGLDQPRSAPTDEPENASRRPGELVQR